MQVSELIKTLVHIMSLEGDIQVQKDEMTDFNDIVSVRVVDYPMTGDAIAVIK